MKLLALSALCVSILSNLAVAGLDEGVAAYQAGDLPLAVKEFRAAAEAGNSDAQFNMALMYERGIGVSKDEQVSVDWYQKSAEQGNSNAQYNLAVMYENGRGTAVDY
jgi:TPR repeat protein